MLAGDRYSASSAKLSPAVTVNPAIAASIAELELDISDGKPRAVTVEDLESTDVVVAMKPRRALPAALSGRFSDWEFLDPTDRSAESGRPLCYAIAVKQYDIRDSDVVEFRVQGPSAGKHA